MTIGRFVIRSSGSCVNMSPKQVKNLGKWAMAIVEFEFIKEEARGKQTNGKFQFDTKAAALTYEVLREAEAAFLRWFRSFHSNHSLVDWKASVEHRGIVAKYSASLPYGFPKTEASGLTEGAQA